MAASASASSSSSSNSIVVIGVTCNSDKESPILREGITDLFKIYFDELYELGCDLGFQGFQNEWIDLPGKYDFNKRGGIFVAVESSSQNDDDDGDDDDDDDDDDESSKGISLKDKNQVVGCIAIRQLTDTCGEVKRMYIRKTHRRSGIGKLLAKQIIDHAWEKGKYDELKLSSRERLVGAVTLYENLGFNRIDPYCECPEDDHVCMNMFRK